MIRFKPSVLPFLLLFLSSSCSLFEQDEPDPYGTFPFLKGDGAFIINEGNFLSGNGSVSFFSEETSTIYNDLFVEANGIPLGDVPNSMAADGENIYIVVNNSGKVEVADGRNMKSSGKITNLTSPRTILLIDQTKAYITSLYSKEIMVADIRTKVVTGKIRAGRFTECMVKRGNKVYVSCWSSANKILVINSSDDRLTDSIDVGAEPESMVLDREGLLWVICSGGYAGQALPELIAINTSTDRIQRRLTFPGRNIYPSSLAINGAGDRLYFLGNDIWTMGINDPSLPSVPLVRSRGRLFYRIAVNPVNGTIYATNAVDFRQRGYLLRFRPDGSVIDSARTDIIPGAIYFRKSTP